MDPVSLAALGMAGNIVQFVDFGYKIVSKARKIHKDGYEKESVDLQVVIDDLARCSENLRADLDSQQQQQQANGMLADDDASLREICSGCLLVAGEIQTALKGLGTKGTTQTKWTSVRQALKTIWGKERLLEMKGRLEMYTSQIDSHILISLRKRIDLGSLYQKGEFTNLGDGIKAIVERSKELEARLAEQARTLEANDTAILEVVMDSKLDNREEHERTREAVMETASNLQEASTANHQETLRHVTSLGVQVTGAVKGAADASERQHEVTMTEIELIRAATEQQVRELREEIRQLKIEIERSVQKVVSSVGKVSASEQQRLKEVSNAKFNVWVAKEIALKNLLEILKIFKSQIGDWVAAFEAATWKTQSYPTIKPSRGAKPSETDIELKTRFSISGGPAGPTKDTGHNVAHAQALKTIRDNQYIPESISPRFVEVRRFDLDSAGFFDEVFGACYKKNKHHAAQILLDAGAKPTYRALMSALRTWERETVSLIANAIFFGGGQESCSDPGRINQIIHDCGNHDLAELVHLVQEYPGLVDQEIDGFSPLTLAIQSGNRPIVDILILYGASPMPDGRILNSPLEAALDQWDLTVARLMLEHSPSFLESGWEWHVLKRLADNDFAARSEDVDGIVRKIGILHGLRLAIENRHERLMTFMLWRLKADSIWHGKEGSGEVLEMALQSGICREYVEYVKGFTEKYSATVASTPATVGSSGRTAELEGLEF